MADPIGWDQYLVTSSEYDDDGTLMCGIDRYGEGDGDPLEVISIGGLLYRPSDPVDGKACPSLVASDGGKRMLIPVQDPRVPAKALRLAKGDAALVADGGAFIRLGNDGSIRQYTTTDGTPTGTAVYQQIKRDVSEFQAPWGRTRFDASGFHVTTHGGARLDIGQIGGMPAPLSAFSTFATLEAQSVSLRGTLVSLGPAMGTFDAAAKSAPILAYLASLQTALATAISAAGPGGPGAATAFTATMAGVLAALTASLPAKSVSVA